MPLLDVSDVLDDPLFADTITVTRNVETMVNGRAVIAPTEIPNVSAVVTAGQGDILKQLPEGTRMEGAVLVHTKYRLTAESETTQPDTVTWQGRDYTVTMLNDWSTFGAGFMIAACTLKNLQEAAP
jgi:hypothetical protein